MQTQLEAWMVANNKTLRGFARELGLATTTIYKLLGRRYAAPRNPLRSNQFFSIEIGVLRIVSAATGIDVATLYDEAERAMREEAGGGGQPE